MTIELKKHPVTEAEYFSVLHRCGAEHSLIMHELYKGNTKNYAADEIRLNEIADLCCKLGREICEKFNVIGPENYPWTQAEIDNCVPCPPAPEGKTWYFEWYNQQKEKAYQERCKNYETNYDKIICSACPFSQGFKKMQETDGCAPCQLIQDTPGSGGPIYLRYPWRCEAIDRVCSEQKFLEKLKKMGCEEIMIFQNKAEKIKPLQTRKVPVYDIVNVI